MEIAIVHRHRYQDSKGAQGDYVLPKGKADPGERLVDTALREVREETGCVARITGPPVIAQYEVKGLPKVVAFFPMECDRLEPLMDSLEVREVLWLSPAEALTRLTYETERSILQSMLRHTSGKGVPRS